MFELSKKDPTEADTAQSPKPSRSYRTSSAAPEGNAVIGRSIKIVGDLKGDEDLRIEGDIDGTIQLLNHNLTIGAEGRINADAYAKSVIIDGEINGDVHGSECVTIRSKARVVGNIVSSRVSVEEGAQFRGSIDMDPKSVNSALEKVQVKSIVKDDERDVNGASPIRSEATGLAETKTVSGKVTAVKPSR